jgi:tRNA-binding protein
MIFTYNKNIGNVLLVLIANTNQHNIDYLRQKDVTRIYRIDNGQTVGWNFFNISQIIPEIIHHDDGQIFLTDQEIEKLNQQLEKANFEERISNEHDPKFVIGQIVDLQNHPDSDHLKIAQVQISDQETRQIVVGAPNVALGQKVVVAKPSAQMPDGSIIWPGELRGVKSWGMLASPRELHLPNAPQKRGILILPQDTPLGIPFDPQNHWPQ